MNLELGSTKPKLSHSRCAFTINNFGKFQAKTYFLHSRSGKESSKKQFTGIKFPLFNFFGEWNDPYQREWSSDLGIDFAISSIFDWKRWKKVLVVPVKNFRIRNTQFIYKLCRSWPKIFFEKIESLRFEAQSRSLAAGK